MGIPDTYKPCADCGHDTSIHYGIAEYFMVHNDLWADALDARDDDDLIRDLCIGCLEQRLGYQLDRNDFVDTPINNSDKRPWSIRSLRFQDRLRREAGH